MVVVSFVAIFKFLTFYVKIRITTFKTFYSYNHVLNYMQHVMLSLCEYS